MAGKSIPKISKDEATHKGLSVFAFADFAAWSAWLDEHFDQSEAIWVKLAKKKSGVKSVTYEEAREAAIIFGWIDGQLNSWDEQFYLIRFSARRRRSNWSKINTGIAEQLIRQGRMKPSGMAQVKSAKEDGRWQNAYLSSSKIEVPADFQQKLNTNPAARKQFETLTRTQRYGFLYRITTARKPHTRQRWIERSLEVLAQGKTNFAKTSDKESLSSIQSVDDSPRKKK